MTCAATTSRITGSSGPTRSSRKRSSRSASRALLAAAVLALAACSRAREADTGPDPFEKARLDLVARCVEPAGVTDAIVLRAMREVPRHLFVPERLRSRAYEDTPLPLDEGQTISQPSLVAFMTQSIRPRPGAKVLEIGTGSGYQAAVLAACGVRVFSIEIDPALARLGRRNLEAAGIEGVALRVGDGYRGWPEEAPFDAIVVTAAPDHVPPALVTQLAPGGLLVLPVGDRDQELILVEKARDGSVSKTSLFPVRFVPMTGEALERSK